MPAGLLRLRKPSVVIRKFGNGFCNGCNGYNGFQEEGRRKFGNGFAFFGCNGCNGCQEEGRRKKEEGRGKNATGNVWDLTYTRKQEKGR
jgi:hypothetical protein